MSKRYLNIMAAVALSATCSVALANHTSTTQGTSTASVEHPFYIGVGALFNDTVDSRGLTTGAKGTAGDRFSTDDSHRLGGKVFMGYWFKQWAALELSVARPGRTKIERESSTGSNVDTLKSWYWLTDLDTLGKLDVGHGVYTFGKLGVTWVHEKFEANDIANFLHTSVNGSSSESFNKATYNFALGLGYQYKQLGVRAGYTYYKEPRGTEGSTTLPNLWSVDFSYSF